MTPGMDDGKMQNSMTRAEFETLLACHGADMAAWPQAARSEAAEMFARSAEGKGLMAAETAFRRRLEGYSVPDAGADAFLDRLLDVPDTQAQGMALGGLSRWLRAVGDVLGDSHKLFSRTGIATQVAASVMILALGVMIGLGSPAEQVSELDLSAALFASSDLNFGGQ